MNKLLVICGVTAAGKTSLALDLAIKFNGELISVDSRQVYKGMNIGTGKDIPSEFKYQESSIKFQKKGVGFYTDGKTKIWGYDLFILLKSNSIFFIRCSARNLLIFARSSGSTVIVLLRPFILI